MRARGMAADVPSRLPEVREPHRGDAVPATDARAVCEVDEGEQAMKCLLKTCPNPSVRNETLCPEHMREYRLALGRTEQDRTERNDEAAQSWGAYLAATLASIPGDDAGKIIVPLFVLECAEGGARVSDEMLEVASREVKAMLDKHEDTPEIMIDVPYSFKRVRSPGGIGDFIHAVGVASCLLRDASRKAKGERREKASKR